MEEQKLRRILEEYASGDSRESIQNRLAQEFGVTRRTIRRWVREYTTINEQDDAKIMVYDIETSRMTFKTWWTGKQYLGADAILTDTQIISVSWKWLGEDEVHSLHWNLTTHSDRNLIKKFLKEYNKADMVIGYNNDRFDNRFINSKGAEYGFEVNTSVRSYDLMKKLKSKFRLPAYSMKYVSKRFGVTQKHQHAGIIMWDMIESGTPEEQKWWINEMVYYNEADIKTTEELYLKLRPYLSHTTHIGVIEDSPKWSSPFSGTTDVTFYKKDVTPAGTVQYLMRCDETNGIFRISKSEFLKWVEEKS